MTSDYILKTCIEMLKQTEEFEKFSEAEILEQIENWYNEEFWRVKK